MNDAMDLDLPGNEYDPARTGGYLHEALAFAIVAMLAMASFTVYKTFEMKEHQDTTQTILNVCRLRPDPAPCVSAVFDVMDQRGGG